VLGSRRAKAPLQSSGFAMAACLGGVRYVVLGWKGRAERRWSTGKYAVGEREREVPALGVGCDVVRLASAPVDTMVFSCIRFTASN
jgi:hypothetical protein